MFRVEQTFILNNNEIIIITSRAKPLKLKIEFSNKINK